MSKDKIKLVDLNGDDYDWSFRKQALSVFSYQKYLRAFDGTYNRTDVEDFIGKNYIDIMGDFTIDPDTNIIDVDGNVIINVCDEVKQGDDCYTRIPFNFGRVTGTFDASGMVMECSKLTSMCGFPIVVLGDCDVSGAELVSLKYAPRIVNGYFSLGFDEDRGMDFCHWEPEHIDRLHISWVKPEKVNFDGIPMNEIRYDEGYNDYIIRVSNIISKCKQDTPTVTLLSGMVNRYYELKMIDVI